ncbi:MAG: glycine--tRNA ligase subunit beta [Synergistaceae bacterium]|nr:glycine--tRNA ligase subunit beta [Synergistaceae bacterium]
MSARDMLFEIGTEEIPARFMPKALQDIYSYSADEFASAHISCGEITVRCTPRRLILLIKDVADKQMDIVEIAKGPMKAQAFDAEGKPTKAAEGFARSRGVSVEDLTVQSVNGTEYVAAEKREAGKPTAEVLPGILERIIKKLSFQKSMYWADRAVRFARPVRWMVALYGEDTVDVSFGNVKSGNISRGHRFMGAASVEIKDPSKYASAMADNFVVADPEERRMMILDGISQIEKKLGAIVDVDPALLDENVHLVEYPVVFYGSFDKGFLDIPEEVLTLSMAKNQRYFPVRDTEGRLMANFVGVSNNRAKDMTIVREGNERVLRARLYDAAFFWKEDQKKSLDVMAEELRSVTYQEQLGSVYDKVQRVKALALRITDMLAMNDIRPYVERAAEISKADLVSNMVYEFADVQGVMGREYARISGEPDEVSTAIYEQYLPRFAGDEIPSSYSGAILGLAERADTIAAIYKIGLEPTSSQDPYGLRRAARCINEIIWGLGLDIDINKLMAEAAVPLGLDKTTMEKISAFLRQRMQVQLKEKGLKHEVIMLAVQTVPSLPLQVYRMAGTLQKSSDEAWFAGLITAAVRVKNLLGKAGDVSGSIDPSKFTTDPEKNLYDKLLHLTVYAKDAVSEFDWEKLASILAELAPVISQFFEDVLVMDNDPAIRSNRLALLKKCQEFFMQAGDFSLLK